MIVRGIEVVFPVLLCKIGEADKTYCICDTAEETVEIVAKLKKKLAEGESVFVRVGEVIGNREHLGFEIDGFDGSEFGRADKSLVAEMKYYARQLVPAQSYTPIKVLPYVKKRAKGKKRKPLSAYKYVCMSCGKLNGTCNCDGDFKRYGVNARVRKIEPWGERQFVQEELEWAELVCPWCWNPVAECECERWPEYALSIDKNMIPVIRTFNKKGYKTTYCCEGHSIDGELYISFAARYNFRKDLPVGWYKDAKRCFRAYYDPNSEVSFENQKKERIQDMLEWAESLRTIDRFITC